MPCISDTKPAIDSIESELTQTKEKLSETEREMRQVEIDHAFNWWWYNNGNSGFPLTTKPLNESIEDIARSAFIEAATRFRVDAPLPAKMTEERAGLLYSLFAIGVVVGMLITLVMFLFVINPK